MKLVFFESQTEQQEHIQSAFPNDEIQFVTEPLTESNAHLAKGAEVVSVFIDSRVEASVIEQLQPELRLVATRSTGFDHINQPSAKQYGIQIVNVPHYGENTVAQHTMALILMLSRKLYRTIERTEQGDYSLDGLRGFDLAGKTLGIYGLGRIGEYVAQMATGFDLNIIAYKRTPDPELTEKYGIKFVDGIETLLQQSDILTLHCPLTPETEHLINKNNIHLAKPGMIFINTARGGLFETEALIQGLDQGLIAAAGLDVLEEEAQLKEERFMYQPAYREKTDMITIMEDHLLIARDNVVFTAHNAFNSDEAVMRILNTTLDNIHQFQQGTIANSVIRD